MKPEWYSMYEELRRALKKFADFNRKLFIGKNREQYDKDLISYTDCIEHNFFTDREMIYYRKFEEKATSTIDELLSEKKIIKENDMNAHTFFMTVRELRICQKNYFRNRDQESLKQSKHFEEIIDREIKRVENEFRKGV